MNAADEYLAARNGAGTIDLGARGRILVRGADRKTFLHALLTNDIALLAGGTFQTYQDFHVPVLNYVKKAVNWALRNIG